MVRFGFNGISTIAGYLMPNPLYAYVLYIFIVLFLIYGLSTIEGYSMPNCFNTYILNIYNLVWFGFMAYQPLKNIQCQILLIHIC